jgi:hypothetical protein
LKSRAVRLIAPLMLQPRADRGLGCGGQRLEDPPIMPGSSEALSAA